MSLFKLIYFDFRISDFQTTDGQILTQIYLNVMATLIIERYWYTYLRDTSMPTACSRVIAKSKILLLCL